MTAAMTCLPAAKGDFVGSSLYIVVDDAEISAISSAERAVTAGGTVLIAPETTTVGQLPGGAARPRGPAVVDRHLSAGAARQLAGGVPVTGRR